MNQKRMHYLMSDKSRITWWGGYLYNFTKTLFDKLRAVNNSMNKINHFLPVNLPVFEKKTYNASCHLSDPHENLLESKTGNTTWVKLIHKTPMTWENLTEFQKNNYWQWRKLNNISFFRFFKIIPIVSKYLKNWIAW